MASKLKLIFSDLFRSVRKLWLEMMGALFFSLALMFMLNTAAEYRKATDHFSNWDWRTSFAVVGSGFFSVLMMAFSFHSFWKARKMRS